METQKLGPGHAEVAEGLEEPHGCKLTAAPLMLNSSRYRSHHVSQVQTPIIWHGNLTDYILRSKKNKTRVFTIFCPLPSSKDLLGFGSRLPLVAAVVRIGRSNLECPDRSDHSLKTPIHCNHHRCPPTWNNGYATMATKRLGPGMIRNDVVLGHRLTCKRCIHLQLWNVGAKLYTQLYKWDGAPHNTVCRSWLSNTNQTPQWNDCDLGRGLQTTV